MKYLTMEEVLFMHFRILTGLQPDNDDFTVLNPGSLDSALARPQQTLFGDEAYKDAYSKAAALTESLISNHCFRDGNKRVGITAGMVFMMNNGYETKAYENDVFEAAMYASKGEWKFNELKEWFNKMFFEN